MELPLIILTIGFLFWFSNSLTKLSKLVEKIFGLGETAVDTIADASSDTIKTYSNEIFISNAETRQQQGTKLDNMPKPMYTNDAIKAMLNPETK